jgi:hypothetical protein
MKKGGKEKTFQRKPFQINGPVVSGDHSIISGTKTLASAITVSSTYTRAGFLVPENGSQLVRFTSA